MNDAAKTFLTALGAVASAAVIALCLADPGKTPLRSPGDSAASQGWAQQHQPGVQSPQASRPRG